MHLLLSQYLSKNGGDGALFEGGVLILNLSGVLIYCIHLILQVQMVSGITMPRFLIPILMLELEQCPLRGPVI